MARTKEQNEKMRNERKKMIMDAAVHLFSSKGFFATKIKDIAVEAQMAQGLVYHYYKSKDDVYYDVLHNAFEKMNEAVEGLKQLDVPAEKKIRMAIRELIKTIDISDNFNQTVRIIASATNSTAIPEKVKALLSENRDISYRIMAAIFEEGQRDGSVVGGDPYELAVAFWSFINGLAVYKATRLENFRMPSPEILYHTFLKTNEAISDT